MLLQGVSNKIANILIDRKKCNSKSSYYKVLMNV